jgi:predicted Fe-Mo cluster-binding NifX family protein
MRICIPTETDDGLAAAVAGHLGRAPFLTLVDTESGGVEVMASAPHGGGACSPVTLLASAAVEALVCQGAGRRAVASLEAAGIRVLLTSALRVEDAAAAARDGRLRVLGAKEACGGRHGDALPDRCRQDA